MSTLTTAQKEATPAKRAQRILYADDIHELREVVRLTLADETHEIECVVDGRAALQRIATDPAAFDVVITDHSMPNMNGLELVTQLRAQRFPGKIVLFSSQPESIMRETYENLDVDRIIHKPLRPDELKQALASL